MIGFGVYILAVIFLPGGTEAVVFFFPSLVFIAFGLLLVAIARAAWVGSETARWGGVTLAVLIGLGALIPLTASLRLFDAPPSSPPSIAAAGLWLLVVGVCLAVVLLLGLAWTPRTASPTP